MAASPAVAYSGLVRKTTGMSGAYPLVVPVKVGDYLQFGDDGIPVPLGNVRSWPGWDTLKVKSEAISGEEVHSTACGRKNGVGGGAGVTTPAGIGVAATVSLEFSKTGGFFLAYRAARHRIFRDLPTAQSMVLNAVQNGTWDRSWVLVTEVIEAKSASLLVSTTKSSSISLFANASTPLGALGISDPDAHWSSSGWSTGGYVSLCSPGTPLFRCARVKKKFLGGTSITLQRAAITDPSKAFTDDPYADV